MTPEEAAFFSKALVEPASTSVVPLSDNDPVGIMVWPLLQEVPEYRTLGRKAILLALSLYSPITADKRTPEQTASAVGVSQSELYGLNQNPLYLRFVETLKKKNIKLIEAEVTARMGRQAAQGDVNAARLVMDRADKYDQQNAREVAFTTIISRLVDAVNRYVTDPEVLKGIRDEIKLVLAMVEGNE